MPTRKSAYVLLALAVATGLGGCSTVRRATGRTGRITVAALLAPDANGNSALAVDIVTVEDKKVLAEVSKMAAQAWFGNKRDYLRLHPGQLHVSSWEWVPGQTVALFEVKKTEVAAGVLLFANYSTPGAHAAVLPDSGTVRIQFGPADFRLVTSLVTSP